MFLSAGFLFGGKEVQQGGGRGNVGIWDHLDLQIECQELRIAKQCNVIKLHSLPEHSACFAGNWWKLNWGSQLELMLVRLQLNLLNGIDGNGNEHSKLWPYTLGSAGGFHCRTRIHVGSIMSISFWGDFILFHRTTSLENYSTMFGSFGVGYVFMRFFLFLGETQR